MGRLNDWRSETPVIQTREQAIEGARMSTLAGKCLADIDDGRKALVRPLNDQVGAINLEHREAVAPLKAILAELDKRVTAFAKAEEAARKAEAAEKRRLAQEASHRAGEAGLARREAVENASQGEAGVDIIAAVQDEFATHAAAERAWREAARAERDTSVRLPTGFGNARSLRGQEVLIIVNPTDAIIDILHMSNGVPDDLYEAIRKSAKAFRALYGRLPAGVESTTERKI
jgi:hypothetical protein